MFAKWPKQDLRPDYQLQDVLGKTVDARFQNFKPAMEREELLKARALQFLLQDKFKDRVCGGINLPPPPQSHAILNNPLTAAIATVQAARPDAATQEPADLL